MTHVTRFFLALVFALTLSAGAYAATDKRVALVIGNGAYKAPLDLPNPPDDGRAVAGALSRVGFEVIEGYDLTNAAMTAKLKEFSRALQGADVGLFYYAGHGMQVAGENYLVPVDASLKDERDLEFEAIKVDLVLRQLLRDAKIKIVILDACRDNPLAAQISRSMGAARSRSANPLAGMAAIDAQNATGTMIAFATAPGTVALDGNGGHSPFTTALLNHLETPNLDIDLMMKRVRGDVARSTGDRQQPWTNSSLTTEFFMKTDAAGGATAAAAPAAAPTQIAAANTTGSVEAGNSGGTVTRALEMGGAVTPELRGQRADKASEVNLAFTRDQVQEISVRLVLLGFSTATIGPTITSGTRKALSAFQSSVGLVPTGYLNRGQYELLKSRSEVQYAAWTQQGKPTLGATASESDPASSADEPAKKTQRSGRSSGGSAASGPSARQTGEFLGGVARGLSRGRLGF